MECCKLQPLIKVYIVMGESSFNSSEITQAPRICFIAPSDSFTILGLWVLGLAVSNINESQLQTYESKTLFLMTSLQYYINKNLCAKDAGCAGIKITVHREFRKKNISLFFGT